MFAGCAKKLKSLLHFKALLQRIQVLAFKLFDCNMAACIITVQAVHFRKTLQRRKNLNSTWSLSVTVTHMLTASRWPLQGVALLARICSSERNFGWAKLLQ